MKRVIICIILVAMMLVLACGCYFYTQSVTENVERRLSEISDTYESGDSARARVLSGELGAYWRDYCSCRVLLTDSGSADGITFAIAKISAMTKNGDDGVITECASALSLVEAYRESQSLRLLNIL